MKAVKFSRDKLIALLQDGTGYQSGETLAEKLGVTRAAVWKAIRHLEAKGYEIESSQAKGYRIVSPPDLDPLSLRQGLSSARARVGNDIRFFESAESTNTIAMDMASQGAEDGTVVLADTQTAGKGRLGRTWISPPGKNLYMSIILRPDLPPRDAPLLTLMAAVACATAIRLSTEVPCAIKWPNDLVIGTKKLGGILTLLKADPDQISHAVVGIGLNVNLMSGDMSDEIRSIATSLAEESGSSHNRTEIARMVLVELGMWYQTLREGGKPRLLDAWRELSSTIGSEVRVNVGIETFTGTAEGIDEEGLLMIRLEDGMLRKVSAGDVTLLRAVR